MILFDLNVSQVNTELLRCLAMNCKQSPAFSKSRNSISKSCTLAYAVKNPEILTINNTDLAQKKLMYQGQVQKIFNRFWQQVVFMSAPSKSYDQYMVDLNYLGMHKTYATNKHLISEFSKALLKGSVGSSLSNESSLFLPSVSSIQYTWRKSLKQKQEKIVSLFQSNVYQDHVRCVKKYLSRSNSMNHFPLFAVSNYLGQMVISEPPGDLEVGKSSFDYIVAPGNQAKTAHQGWFFTSYEDAREYMESINEYYNLKKNHLKIFACNLSTFYKIIGNFANKVHFRLLPDLEEVGRLTRVYRYYRHVSFHSNQKHSSKYFQGQPLYMLKSKDAYEDSPSNKDGVKNLDQYHLVFTSYRTARKVLGKTCLKTLNSRQFKMPNLVVYNLESLIEDEARSGNNLTYSLLLVPSENAYRFTKEHFLNRKMHLLHGNFLNYVSSMHLWSKRILWSLTSKQPYGW